MKFIMFIFMFFEVIQLDSQVPLVSYLRRSPVIMNVSLPLRLSEIEEVWVKILMKIDLKCFKFQGFEGNLNVNENTIYLSAHFEKNLLKNCNGNVEEIEKDLSLGYLSSGRYKINFLGFKKIFTKTLEIELVSDLKKEEYLQKAFFLRGIYKNFIKTNLDLSKIEINRNRFSYWSLL